MLFRQLFIEDIAFVHSCSNCSAFFALPLNQVKTISLFDLARSFLLSFYNSQTFQLMWFLRHATMKDLTEVFENLIVEKLFKCLQTQVILRDASWY